MVEVGLYLETAEKIGKEWQEFQEAFLPCLEFVDDIPMNHNGWHECPLDQKLVDSMALWFKGKVMTQASARELPDNFLALWETHLFTRIYTLTGLEPSKLPAELKKCKWWCFDRDGVVIVAAGLYWGWLFDLDKFSQGKKVTHVCLLFCSELYGLGLALHLLTIW